MLLALSGCASLRGRPEPITAADVKDRICPSAAQMAAFQRLSGEERGYYRDRVVTICIGAYNRRFADYTSALSSESISTNLFVDLASSGLTTLAGIASPKTAKRLTAGAGLALGLGSAVDKNVFFNATLPALITAMDAQRADILKSIIEAEQADPLGVNYSLARAAVDLDRYEDAGTLVSGLNALNKAASTAAQKAADELAAAQRLSYRAAPLDTAVQPRVVVLTRKVQGIPDNPAGRAKLDAMALKLGLPVSATDATDVKQGYVITAILGRVNVPDPAQQQTQIGKLEADLNPLF